MQALDKDLRGALEKTVKSAREIAEIAAFAALDQLGVGHDKPEAFLSDTEKAMRNRLRTHGKQLGDARDRLIASSSRTKYIYKTQVFIELINIRAAIPIKISNLDMIRRIHERIPICRSCKATSS